MCHSGRFKLCVFQKVDLDTVLAGFLTGIKPGVPLLQVQDKAPQTYLDALDVLCLECGGSGDVGQNNFDHHNTTKYIPPASTQAFEKFAVPDHYLEKLVKYVADIDEGRCRLYGQRNDSTLSEIFSGMLMCCGNTEFTFIHGLNMIEKVVSYSLDPLCMSLQEKEWIFFKRMKSNNRKRLQEIKDHVKRFVTEHDIRGGILITHLTGVHGLMRKMGIDLSIAAKPINNKWKYTVGSSGFSLFDLLCTLQRMENGWGGPAHGKIIGGPISGSKVIPSALVNVICEVC